MAQLSLHARRRGETLEEERLSYLNLQRHPAMEYGEVRSVVALKRGVGDHSPERFADHELRRNANHGGFSLSGQGRWIGNRLSGLAH